MGLVTLPDSTHKSQIAILAKMLEKEKSFSLSLLYGFTWGNVCFNSKVERCFQREALSMHANIKVERHHC